MTDTKDPTAEPEVAETKPATTALATIGVTDASAEAYALMEQRVENQKKMFKLALSLTTPSQWTVFSGHDKDGVLKQSVYPTGGAADTVLRRAFGLVWGPKDITVYEGKHGPEAVCTSWLKQGDREIEQFEGRRSMGGFVKTEADLRKGAIENMKSTAVRDILGLRFRTPAELKEMGLDLGKTPPRAEFQSHGGNDGGDDVPRVPFGKNKGKPLTELGDKSFEWYLNAAREAVADPDKAKWRAKNQKWLDQCDAESARRAGKANGAAQETTPIQDGAGDMPPWPEGEDHGGIPL